MTKAMAPLGQRDPATNGPMDSPSGPERLSYSSAEATTSSRVRVQTEFSGHRLVETIARSVSGFSPIDLLCTVMSIPVVPFSHGR